MAIRDILAAEDSDARGAAAAAAAGRSITGFSGRHSDIGDRFSVGPDQAYGARVEPPGPLTGERLAPMRMASAGDVNDAVPTVERRAVEISANRKPFGSQEQVLAYPPRPGYRRYWFSDRPGRINRAKEAGYAHVTDDSGQPVSRITDQANGRGRASYLMEIRIEWYQEDMGRQAADLERRLNDIRRGTAGPGSDDNRYIPQQGIRITGR